MIDEFGMLLLLGGNCIGLGGDDHEVVEGNPASAVKVTIYDDLAVRLLPVAPNDAG
jgi:hypothetical protein